MTRSSRTGHLAGRPLSDRELELIRVIALGLTNDEVATQLNVTPGVVKAMLKRVAGKLETRNRTHSVVTCLKMGLITLGSESETRPSRCRWLLEIRHNESERWRPMHNGTVMFPTKDEGERELIIVRRRNQSWQFQLVRATTIFVVESEDE